MNKILYLSFYFEPDLCAGSFRNSPLVKELAHQLSGKDFEIDLYTTLPNRYKSYSQEAPTVENRPGVKIHRIQVPIHKSGFLDQIFAFKKFYLDILQETKNEKYILIVASSSRLFTAFLGYKIAKSKDVKLYLDIRDIFVDTITDVVKSKTVKLIILPFLKIIENRVFNYASHINLISEGFKEYFTKFPNPKYTFYTNGIDEEFVNSIHNEPNTLSSNISKQIVYAGNIGEGQGLEKIIPDSARLLGEEFSFLIIGDGGAKIKLVNEIKRLGIKNVVLKSPVNRKELIEIYESADYLFLHLNDYKAFEKVLPSKIFELSVFEKPLIAGVNGFSKIFIENNIPNSIVFQPGNANEFVEKLKKFKFNKNLNRKAFVKTHMRSTINRKIVTSILDYL